MICSLQGFYKRNQCNNDSEEFFEAASHASNNKITWSDLSFSTSKTVHESTDDIGESELLCRQMTLER